MPLSPPPPRPTISMRDFARAATRLSTWLALALLTFVWAGTTFYLQLDQQKSIEAATDNTGNMARVFEEHVARSIKDIDKTLLFLRHAYEADPAGFDLPAWTTNAYLLQDLTVQIALIGPDGHLISTNVARNPAPMDLSDREHFRVHAGRSGDDLFISRPVLGRATGKWTIQLTRRLSRADGSFGGVIVASLDPYHLSKFFEQIDLGSEGSITLCGTDGLIRARGGLDPTVLGQSIVGSPLFAAMMSAPKGSFIGPAPLSNTRGLISFRRMKDFPLLVAVAETEAEILADHNDKRDIFLSTAAGLSVLISLVMIVGIVHELRLTRARLAEQESERRVIRKSEELESTLLHMSQGLIMLDAGGHLRIVNDRAREMLGRDLGWVIGRAMPAEARALLGQRRTIDARLSEISLPDGVEIELVTTEVPDGGTLYTLTDITIRKHTEIVLAEARDRAEAATRTRTAFLATMSHELRTPLNGVVGISHLLADCAEPAERAAYVATICNSAEHLLQIIDDILDVSKLEADRVTFEAVPFDLGDAVRTVVGMVAPKAQEKSILLATSLAPDVPRRIVGDAARLRQILLNLVGNAVKFTDAGSVVVQLDMVAPTAPGAPPRLRMRVQDTGIGIAEDSLQNLFVEFSQLDGSITRRFGGTGLGLAISRKLIEKMGGEISVTSTLGEGSIFTALIPAPTAADRVEPAGIAAPAAVTGSPLEILLAEDNATNTMIATRILQKMGHRVTAVGDGLAALEALAERPFDVVLMDMMMPRMDGLTATRRIRAGATPQSAIPIVALTANALEEDREAARLAGLDAFTTKPISSERLRNAIAEARAQRSAASDPTMPPPADARTVTPDGTAPGAVAA